MDYAKLGNTGMDVSRICLGCMSFGTAEGWVHNEWALDEEASRTIIKKALDLGINFLIRRTCTLTAPARRFSGGHLRTMPTVMKSSSPLSYTAKCATAPTVPGSHVRPS